MSWFASFTVPKGISYTEISSAFPEGDTITDASDEAQTSFAAALNYVRELIDESEIGGGMPNSDSPLPHGVLVQISGHSNPGNEPCEGMANDYLTISLTQISDTPPAE